MASLWRVRVYGIAAVFLLSAVSIVFHLYYEVIDLSLGRPLSLLIYAAAGFAAGRLAGVSAAVYTGLLVSFVSTILALPIFWLLNFEKWPKPLETSHIIGIIGIFIGLSVRPVIEEVVFGGILGLIGGVLGRWSTQRVRVDA
jgi:hypothetical protein